MPDDARDVRLRDLEQALADVAAEAALAAHALCPTELQMRLENIARRLAQVRPPEGEA